MTIGTSMWAISWVSTGWRVGCRRSAALGGGGRSIRPRPARARRLRRFDCRLGIRIVEGHGLVVLEMRQRWVVGMRRQPLVDELLDEPAAPQRAPDEAPTAVRLEAGHGLAVVAVALAGAANLCV